MLLRRAGCAVDRQDDPFYWDAPRRGTSPKLENLPNLQRAVQSLNAGERLVVCTLAHFASAAVWYWVATECARRGATVSDIDSGKLFDFAADPGAAFEAAAMIEEQLRKQRTEKAREAAAELGHVGRRASLTAAQIANCRQMWVETSDDGALKYSTPQIATYFRVSEPTVRRAMTIDGTKEGRQVGRQEALGLHRHGRWLVPATRKTTKRSR